MKSIYMNRTAFGKMGVALAAAALIAGAAAPGVLAEEYTSQFTKTIDRSAAPGSGSLKGNLTFTVGVPAALPSWADASDQLGTAAQIQSPTLTAAFTGTGDSVNVPITFDSDDFSAPGHYLFTLQENASTITGLTTATDSWYIRVRVVNKNAEDPDGTRVIDRVEVVAPDGKSKVSTVPNTYTTHGLTVEKKLAGDFADYRDVFEFTIALEDPDLPDMHMTSVTVKKGDVEADFSKITGETVTFNADGTATVNENITGGQKIEVTGLPKDTGYTITEAGDKASGYTTSWSGITASGPNDKTSGSQEMPDADQMVTVTNTRNAPTPTGLLLDAAPYGIMLAAAGAGGCLLLRKRRDD